MECGDRVRGAALSNDFARASLSLTTLSGNTEFKLDFVEGHTGSHVACDFTVGDSAAYANDHGL